MTADEADVSTLASERHAVEANTLADASSDTEIPTFSDEYRAAEETTDTDVRTMIAISTAGEAAKNGGELGKESSATASRFQLCNNHGHIPSPPSVSPEAAANRGGRVLRPSDRKRSVVFSGDEISASPSPSPSPAHGPCLGPPPTSTSTERAAAAVDPILAPNQADELPRKPAGRPHPQPHDRYGAALEAPQTNKEVSENQTPAEGDSGGGGGGGGGAALMHQERQSAPPLPVAPSAGGNSAPQPTATTATTTATFVHRRRYSPEEVLERLEQMGFLAGCPTREAARLNAALRGPSS
ncbi:hypothetical protein BZA05DRAFT_418692 [Tricharina praecox]|uniref:uncharacterized protein n=1 Tax=Tricharina praecox TaxID=43433 RepID=UPI00221E7ED4|nr:uncharacterized protein BZA05DRAFT_418692 [Tricharina praecox]KAI5851788.1 hypothetical protein BZA05DRAFT_418692 [Tricharina praecox]